LSVTDTAAQRIARPSRSRHRPALRPEKCSPQLTPAGGRHVLHRDHSDHENVVDQGVGDDGQGEHGQADRSGAPARDPARGADDAVRGLGREDDRGGGVDVAVELRLRGPPHPHPQVQVDRDDDGRSERWGEQQGGREGPDGAQVVVRRVGDAPAHPLDLARDLGVHQPEQHERARHQDVADGQAQRAELDADEQRGDAADEQHDGDDWPRAAATLPAADRPEANPGRGYGRSGDRPMSAPLPRIEPESSDFTADRDRPHGDPDVCTSHAHRRGG
jgi:hypothetical protein